MPKKYYIFVCILTFSINKKISVPHTGASWYKFEVKQWIQIRFFILGHKNQLLYYNDNILILSSWFIQTPNWCMRPVWQGNPSKEWFDYLIYTDVYTLLSGFEYPTSKKMILENRSMVLFKMKKIKDWIII